MKVGVRSRHGLSSRDGRTRSIQLVDMGEGAATVGEAAPALELRLMDDQVRNPCVCYISGWGGYALMIPC